MTSSELRDKFLDFFKKNGHTIVPSSSLLPTDPSVLFTTAGMQQFKPYYLGEKSPYGKNVASCQKCIRTSDIEEVGDERHLTFFEMLGNFSFGGYFKEEAIKLAYNFVVKELRLEIDYVTVFDPSKIQEGDWRKNVPEDKESFEIWKKMGVPVKKIRKEGADNFWGPTGDEGPCGPTTEIYVNGIEIWNIVFNQYYCSQDKKLENLKTPGIDTGMGLERLAMVMQKVPTVFETDLFVSLIKLIPTGFEIKKKRIIADHSRAINALIAEEIKPSNKEQGYVLRRLMRRIVTYEYLAKENFLGKLIKSEIFAEEKNKFLETIQNGLKEFAKGADPFMLFTTYGFPIELTIEMAKEQGRKIDIDDFNKKLQKHQELSKTASAGMFKGGLADASAETTKLHTAAHLMLAGLRKVLGEHVVQKGSNINAERLRFDFSHNEKLTSSQIADVENFVNGIIKKGLSVVCQEMDLEQAKKIGAMGVFESKYGEKVKVYTIGEASCEICGGPHVKNTSELGQFKIIKEEASSSGVRRIKAILR